MATWVGAEVVFYLGVWLPRKKRLQAVRADTRDFTLPCFSPTYVCYCDFLASAVETAKDDERGEGEAVLEVC